MPARSLARRAKGRAKLAWETRTATTAAKRACREHPAAVRVCWDLDNTLVDSGRLIRAGRRLEDAIVEAQPVPNMLAFRSALWEALPDAHHLIVSTRTASMRADTSAWLRRHDLATIEAGMVFVPRVDVKRRVWPLLARNASLVIVDDLRYRHESPQPRIYEDLVDFARNTACVYVGHEEIGRIAGEAGEIEPVVAAILDTLPARRSSGSG